MERWAQDEMHLEPYGCPRYVFYYFLLLFLCLSEHSDDGEKHNVNRHHHHQDQDLDEQGSRRRFVSSPTYYYCENSRARDVRLTRLEPRYFFFWFANNSFYI
jgi:hypothetical protein